MKPIIFVLLALSTTSSLYAQNVCDLIAFNCPSGAPTHIIVRPAGDPDISWSGTLTLHRYGLTQDFPPTLVREPQWDPEQSDCLGGDIVITFSRQWTINPTLCITRGAWLGADAPNQSSPVLHFGPDLIPCDLTAYALDLCTPGGFGMPEGWLQLRQEGMNIYADWDLTSMAGGTGGSGSLLIGTFAWDDAPYFGEPATDCDQCDQLEPNQPGDPPGGGPPGGGPPGYEPPDYQPEPPIEDPGAPPIDPECPCAPYFVQLIQIGTWQLLHLQSWHEHITTINPRLDHIAELLFEIKSILGEDVQTPSIIGEALEYAAQDPRELMLQESAPYTDNPDPPEHEAADFADALSLPSLPSIPRHPNLVINATIPGWLGAPPITWNINADVSHLDWAWTILHGLLIFFASLWGAHRVFEEFRRY